MEQEALLAQTKKTATLELLEQGGITLHWDRLISAIQATNPAADEWLLGTVAHQLRSRQLYAFALWWGEEVRGVVLMAPVGIGQERAMNIYAIQGDNISLEDWREYIAQASVLLKSVGYSRLVALTTNPRVIEIFVADNWQVKTYGERIL